MIGAPAGTRVRYDVTVVNPDGSFGPRFVGESHDVLFAARLSEGNRMGCVLEAPTVSNRIGLISFVIYFVLMCGIAGKQGGAPFRRVLRRLLEEIEGRVLAERKHSHGDV